MGCAHVNWVCTWGRAAHLWTGCASVNGMCTCERDAHQWTGAWMGPPCVNTFVRDPYIWTGPLPCERVHRYPVCERDMTCERVYHVWTGPPRMNGAFVRELDLSCERVFHVWMASPCHSTYHSIPHAISYHISNNALPYTCACTMLYHTIPSRNCANTLARTLWKHQGRWKCT